jgi:chromosomal replication initiation ATPase DnaA
MPIEEALFHAWNDAVESRRPMLMTARSAPEDWHLSLPDLLSRLAATPRVRIGAPDDLLLEQLFRKLWRDRGMEVPDDLVRYVLARIDRSFASIARAVELLNAASLARQRPPSIPLAREALLDMTGDETPPQEIRT